MIVWPEILRISEFCNSHCYLWSEVKALVAQSCLTLWDPVNCSLPGSSVHGIIQARILEWVAIPFSRGSSQPRDWTQVSYTAGRFFTIWSPREAPLLCVHFPLLQCRVMYVLKDQSGKGKQSDTWLFFFFLPSDMYCILFDFWDRTAIGRNYRK